MITTQQTKDDSSQLAIDYVNAVYKTVESRNPGEPEFLQAVKRIFTSLLPAIAKHPKYIKNGILERISEPERLITFRVPWVDDSGKVQVNRGFRVQFNSSIGPYKGGTRFHPTVNTSIIKFLGFEQIFKNALTGQPIGGGKGGADFNPKGKSTNEIMRFTQSYMTELSNYIGPNIDIPAGDIGVGAREIGFMFGQYKRMQGGYEAGVLTGKGDRFGGSLARTEATGYGLVYFVNEMLQDHGFSFNGSRVIVSGAGNVAIYAMEKAMQFGAKVVACSDSTGYIYDEKGIDLDTIKRLKLDEESVISAYAAEHPGALFNENCGDIWTIPCDIALPCATQNEIDENAAKLLINNGVKAIAEGANMPSNQNAMDLFNESHILFGPSKAANAGGVAVSALEMAQNSMRLAWSFEKVDAKLHEIMHNIYRESINAAEAYGHPGNLVYGANIAGFIKVGDAMIREGVI
ncbi:NADP-specific glutamate dehydrogenase [Virgibacillus oceani]|uniref:Glutamate dehydrogenase n=1 Tax=Virgibacillus oceani TaxID=1479511 RepID=A0A917M1C0_9BACI|nr:NADP-specific glutamate dehydrogenase [Virgibacillus oceani]GGG71527.1 glutamate dehydrogenase [Virgibacillus oceani]